jgi:hypothetical protein
MLASSDTLHTPGYGEMFRPESLASSIVCEMNLVVLLECRLATTRIGESNHLHRG